MKSNAEEIRNVVGKLVAKWYPDKGVIEIRIKSHYVRIIIPPRTRLLVKLSTTPME